MPARAFIFLQLALEDAVCVSGRSAEAVESAVGNLRREFPSGKIVGCACDVSKPGNALVLAKYAARVSAKKCLSYLFDFGSFALFAFIFHCGCKMLVFLNKVFDASLTMLIIRHPKELGGLDLWVNNAGCTQPRRALITDTPEEDVVNVVGTNLIGTLLGTRAALTVMATQATGGVVVNVDGSGSRGTATPRSAAYGSSKAAIPQLTKTLSREAAALQESSDGGGCCTVHAVSPGMVTTSLLLGSDTKAVSDRGGDNEILTSSYAKETGAVPTPLLPPAGVPKKSLQIFNILAERPETVASWLVPRMRALVSRNTHEKGGDSHKYIRYLTETGVIYRFLTASYRRNRLFDLSGEMQKAAANRKEHANKHK